MINRFMKGFIVISLGFVLGCGGWIQKSKTFIKSPFGEKEEVSEKESEDAKVNHLEKGKNLFIEGKMKAALEEFNAFAQIEPDSPEVHYNLGLTYYELDKYSEAIGEYQKAIRLKPDLAEAYFNMGVVYDQSGQIKNALQAYNSALRYGIDDASIHFNMGLSYLKLSRFEEAKKEFLRAIEIEPNLAEAYNNLGYLAEGAGDLDLAVTNYKKALAMKPDYKLARENLERLEEKKPPAVKERPPVTERKRFSRFFLELDGKWAFSRDMEFEKSGQDIVDIESTYQLALLRFGYRPIQILDIFLNVGATNMGFEDNIPIADDFAPVNFKKVIGPAYGAGLNVDIYYWNRINIGLDGGFEYLMGSNEDELRSKIGGYNNATAEWAEYNLFIKARYHGFNNIAPYVGIIFSKLDGTLELDSNGTKKYEIDYNESDPVGIFLGASYYLGEKIRFQAEGRFLNESSLSFRLKYDF
ncbi:MAG: tetratricopeptide repeat protein [bacterium]